MHPFCEEARIDCVTQNRDQNLMRRLPFRGLSVFTALTVTAMLAVTGCSHQTPLAGAGPDLPEPAKSDLTGPVTGVDPCEIVLVAQGGNGRIDQQISRQQANVRGDKNTLASLERLGWLYVAKARASFDPGYYKLAEQCALCLESRAPHCAEALLLRGHVLQSLHRFKEAETLARELVAQRGLSFDYGLLGDTLMEQGRLEAAAEAYQSMVDSRPDLEAYARISYLRWLKGDVAGATEVMGLALSAASPSAPEAAAWVNTRLALLHAQTGDFETAARICVVALSYQSDYAPALLLQARLLLAEGHNVEAIEPLQRAAKLNPLPEYQWALSEALREAHRDGEAAATEASLAQQGAAADPRTFALYLASRGQFPDAALQLARAELETRGDVFTHDALAWALAANGQFETARTEMEQALSQGTKDPRLFLHAGVIAAKSGRPAEAQHWLAEAAPMLPLLLPSEQKLWRSTKLEVGQADLQAAQFPSAN